MSRIRNKTWGNNVLYKHRARWCYIVLFYSGLLIKKNNSKWNGACEMRWRIVWFVDAASLIEEFHSSYAAGVGYGLLARLPLNQFTHLISLYLLYFFSLVWLVSFVFVWINWWKMKWRRKKGRRLGWKPITNNAKPTQRVEWSGKRKQPFFPFTSSKTKDKSFIFSSIHSYIR